MSPLYVDGANPQRAASSTTGSSPRPNAEAVARAKQLAAMFTAQVEASMLESLNSLTAGDDEEGMEGEGGGDAAAAGEFGDLDALLGAGGLGAGSNLAGAGAGSEAQLAQQLMAALTSMSGSAVGGTAAASSAASISASKDVRANAKVVAEVAREQGVDPTVAVAMMLVESSGNAGAVGDGGTSFGLFQLHEGGMLTAAGLTPEQAYDPRTNATVSLKSLAHEWAKGPGRPPGEIAAASQRPADPAGYARKVDAAMAQARTLLA